MLENQGPQRVHSLSQPIRNDRDNDEEDDNDAAPSMVVPDGASLPPPSPATLSAIST